MSSFDKLRMRREGAGPGWEAVFKRWAWIRFVQGRANLFSSPNLLPHPELSKDAERIEA